MQGARAVQQVIAQSTSHMEVSVGIVWINMLLMDNLVTARMIARTMKASCFHHFHDPDRQVGKIIAQSLGAPGKTAWDIYLFYPSGAHWDESPPPPALWAHQLGVNSWADPARYYRGEDLIEELSNVMKLLSE